jgi:hypothetical protein
MKLLFSIMFALMLAGCGSTPNESQQEPVPVAQPTTDPNLGIGYLLLGQARARLETAAQGKQLDAPVIKRLNTILEQVENTLNNARDSHLNGQAGAAARGLEIADTMLNQVQQDITGAMEETQKQRAAKARKK